MMEGTPPVYSWIVVDDDLGSEWETLKAIPGAKTLVDDVDLRTDIYGLRAHPAVVYRFHDELYGLGNMSIWRYKCHGSKLISHSSPTGRLGDHWIVSYDRAIWTGPKYKERIEGHRDFNRHMVARKDHCFVTLDEVREAFAKIRDKHIANYRREIMRWRENAHALSVQADEYERFTDSMVGFIPSLRD